MTATLDTRLIIPILYFARGLAYKTKKAFG